MEFVTDFISPVVEAVDIEGEWIECVVVGGGCPCGVLLPEADRVHECVVVRPVDVAGGILFLARADSWWHSLVEENASRYRTLGLTCTLCKKRKKRGRRKHIFFAPLKPF